MNKLLLGAVGAALLAVLVLAGTSYTGVDVAHAQANVDFDVDPDITGNANNVLGNGWPVERCVRCDVAGPDMADGYYDCQVDVVVHGDTAAGPIGYDVSLVYSDTVAQVVQWGLGTTLTAACGPGGFGVTCNVADASGMTTGTIQLGPPNAELATVYQIVGNTLSLTGLANAHGAGDPVYADLGTDTLIKLAGATDFSETLPDPGQPFIAGAGYAVGGPGTAGDGTLVRVGLDALSAGVVDFSFNIAPATAIDTGPGPHPLTLYTGQLAINQDCPLPVIDIGVDSVITVSPADTKGDPTKGDIDVSVNDTISVDTTATNYGPDTTSQNVLIEADISAPAGCSIVGPAHDETTVALQFGGTASATLSSTFTIHCAEASDHDFTIDNAASYTDPAYSDPEPVANSDTEVVELEAWASADVKIISMSIVDPPPGIPLGTPTDIIVRKELHNNGPYAPNVAVDMAMSATATPVYPGSEALIGQCGNFFDDDMDGAVNDGCPIVGLWADCDMNMDGDCLDAGDPLYEDLWCLNARDDDKAQEGGPPGDMAVNDGCPTVTAAANITGPSADQVVVENSVTTTEDETFTVTCTSLGLIQIDIDNDLSLKDEHIIDPSPASDSASAMILCVPRFTPTYSFYIDNDNGDAVAPTGNVTCIMGLPCEQETQVDISADWPPQPLALVQNITPLAYNIATSAAITNSAIVGWVDFGIRVDLPGLTPACVKDLGGVAEMTDAAMPGEGYDWTGAALFPNAAPGLGNTLWAGQLDAVVNFVQATYSPVPMPLHARYVGTTGAPLNIPINVLIFDGSLLPGPPFTPPPGYLSLGVTANPDNDLDGLWDETSDNDIDTGLCNDGMDNDMDGDCDALADQCYPGSTPDADCGGDVNAPEGDNICNEGTPASLMGPCSGWDTDDDNNTVLNPDEIHLCTPYHSYTHMLGESQGPGSPETLRTCTVFGPNAGIALLTRGDIGTTTTLMSVVNCITADTDLEVELVKDENIEVGEDLESTETVHVVITNGVGPTEVGVELTQVSTDRFTCVSHLVPELGDTLHEFTVGNQYYSKLSWVEPLMAGSEVRDVTRDYTIVCSEAGSFPNIEQFVVDVEPLDMAELDPLSNTDENHVSVDSDPDVDGDGIPNDEDNCPYNPDPDQTDTDGDGIGDLCDDDDDGDGVDDGVDDCSLVAEDPDGVDDGDGCPDTDVSIDVFKDEDPDVDVSVSTAYPVEVTVTNGNYAAVVDVDLLLVSPNGGSVDAIMDEGCVVSWGDAQAGLDFVEEVICEEGGGDPDICGDDPADRYYLQSQLSGTLLSLGPPPDPPIPMAAGQEVVLDLIAYIHCHEKSLHPDAFELAAGAAPLPPVQEEAVADNILKNFPDVTAWEYADVKKVSFEVLSPPTDMDVSETVPIVVRAVVHNNGPFGPVDFSDEVLAFAPLDCDVTPDSVTTVVNDVPVSVDVVIDNAFDIHCAATSTHEFTFTDEIVVLTEHVVDPDLGNNVADTALAVEVWGYADVKVMDIDLLGLPGTIDVSQDVPVTVEAILHNNGTATPVQATYTLTLDAPADCTVDGQASKEASDQIELPLSVDVPVSMAAVIHCGEASLHEFDYDVVVDVAKDPHLVDPDLLNNVGALASSTTIIGYADVKINTWGGPDDIVWRAGNQVLIGPLAPLGSVTILPVGAIHNNGPYGPVSVNILETAASLEPAVCEIVGDVDVQESLEQSVTLTRDGSTYQVNWLDDPKPPFTCDVEIDLDVTLKDAHVVDTDGASDTLAIEVVRDTDGDGIPDDGDFSDDPDDAPCDSGEGLEDACDDNCQDDPNPDQQDTDDDGIGDVCDDTPYHDDTVKSLMVFGPAPINISDTMGRYMWIIGEIGNLTTHNDTVQLNLTITPPVPAGCDQDIQLILPGHNPFILMALEQKWVLYRVRYECHSPALPGIYPLDIELCIDHIPDVPDGDDTFPANDCQSRTKSLLLE